MSQPQAVYRTKRSEHAEQSVVVRWAQLSAKRWPELDTLYAIPNGAKLSNGGRGWTKLAAEGARKGMPDLCLPCARNGYHALYIEMKVNDNKPTEDQARIMDLLHQQGNLAIPCWTAGEAIQALQEYLESGEMPY